MNTDIDTGAKESTGVNQENLKATECVLNCMIIA